MKIPASFLFLYLITFHLQAQNIKDIIKQGEQAINTTSGSKLTNDDIINGLKEALTIGGENAGKLASRADGYLKNPAIKIPFPKEARDMEKSLRSMGLGKEVDQFVTSLNRAAEDAAKKSAPIFTNAIKKINIQDGLAILKGSDHAATDFLKSKTSTELRNAFKPVIDQSINKANVATYWKTLADVYNKLPFVKKVNTNLSDYTTGKALDGLFLLVAQEEQKIRKNPAAQITDLLKKVFGK